MTATEKDASSQSESGRSQRGKELAKVRYDDPSWPDSEEAKRLYDEAVATPCSPSLGVECGACHRCTDLTADASEPHRWTRHRLWWNCTRCGMSTVNRDEAPPCTSADASGQTSASAEQEVGR